MMITQTHIIQSLGEALAWFEKELSWGVSAGELNHLTGRIGELYAATMTNGQMALSTNQKGYDVIGSGREKISVKTITTSSQVKFNPNTFKLVDRVIILRLKIDSDLEVSVETLLDESAAIFQKQNPSLTYSVSSSKRYNQPLNHLTVLDEYTFQEYTIRRYENSTVVVLVDGILQDIAKPILIKIAMKIGVDILNSNFNQKNTRTLGFDIIRALKTK